MCEFVGFPSNAVEVFVLLGCEHFDPWKETTTLFQNVRHH